MSADSHEPAAHVGVSQTFPLPLEVAFTAKLKEVHWRADDWPCVLPLTQLSRSHHREGIPVWL